MAPIPHKQLLGLLLILAVVLGVLIIRYLRVWIQ